jgi:hypothetical protein
MCCLLVLLVQSGRWESPWAHAVPVLAHLDFIESGASTFGWHDGETVRFMKMCCLLAAVVLIKIATWKAEPERVRSEAVLLRLNVTSLVDSFIWCRPALASPRKNAGRHHDAVGLSNVHCPAAGDDAYKVPAHPVETDGNARLTGTHQPPPPCGSSNKAGRSLQCIVCCVRIPVAYSLLAVLHTVASVAQSK